MIIRRLGSPALPLFGVIVTAAGLGVALWFAITDIDATYLRWPDVAYRLRFVTTILSFVVSPVSAYNAASLSAPKLFTAASLGKRPLHHQLVSVAVAVACLASAAILIGYSPAIIATAMQTRALPFSFVSGAASLTFYLLIIAALSSLIGIALRKIHPLIAAVIALLVSYLIGAFAANEIATWAVLPINSNSVYRYILFQGNYTALSALSTFMVAGALILCVAMVAKLVTAPFSFAQLTVSVIAIIATAGLAGLGQVTLGQAHKSDEDACGRSVQGSEICVDRADSPALNRVVEDLSAIESFAPRPTSSAQYAEFHSYRAGDSAYRSFALDEKERRMDVSRLVLSSLGLDSCSDPLSEGAKVIDRVGVYAVKQTGTYSKSVADHGAFYRTIDESGKVILPEDELSKLPPEVANERIAANIDAITTCHGTFEMLGVPAPQ